MELKIYLGVLWKRKFLILSTLLATLSLVAAYVYTRTPIYEATSTLRLATTLGGSLDWVNRDTNYADRLMNTYVILADNPTVLTELRQRLGIEVLPEISAEILADTELIEITVTATEPALAATAANQLGEILVFESKRLSAQAEQETQALLLERLGQLEAELKQKTQEQSESLPQAPTQSAAPNDDLFIQLKREQYAKLLERYEESRLQQARQATGLSFLALATQPEEPTKQNSLAMLLFGMIVGGMGGVGLAFVLENLDTTLYSTKQIQTVTAMKVLGEVPRLSNKQDMQPALFSYIGANIAAFNPDTPPRTILITSANPGEGKSTIAANLAFAIAQTGRKVALVDGDLHAPVQHKIFHLANQTGVSTLLRYGAPLTDVLQNGLTPGLHIMTSGPLPGSPATILGLPQMAALVHQLQERFDVVIFDTPALLAVPDAVMLAPLVDGVLLVVRRGQARQETVEAVQQRLFTVNARLIGVVVNDITPNPEYQKYSRFKNASVISS